MLQCRSGFGMLSHPPARFAIGRGSHPMSPPDDAALLRRIRTGDQEALGDLLRAHQDRLYNVCLRMVNHPDDAAEITQDAMVKIIEHIDRFRGDAAVTTWMTRIAMNQAVSFLRKRKLRRHQSLDGSDNGRDGYGDEPARLRDTLTDPREQDPTSRVQEGERLGLLREALDRLEEAFRAVIVLRDLEDMSYEQIAQTLELPVGTVKSRLFRARIALREVMVKFEGQPLTAPGKTTR